MTSIIEHLLECHLSGTLRRISLETIQMHQAPNGSKCHAGSHMIFKYEGQAAIGSYLMITNSNIRLLDS